MRKPLLALYCLIAPLGAELVLADNCVLKVTPVVTNPTCTQNAGVARLEVSGGSGSYSYLWATGDTVVAPTLAAGSYKVTVTDRNNTPCYTVTKVSLIGPAPIGVNVTQKNPACAGTNTGVMSCVPKGGNAPYTYTWASKVKGWTKQSTPQVSNLVAGLYTVTVVDTKGCQSMLVVNLPNPTPLTVATTAAAPTSGSLCDGGITASPNGGTPPYTYQWNSGQTTKSLSSLCPSLYNLSVTDANGCSAQVSTSLEPKPSIGKRSTPSKLAAEVAPCELSVSKNVISPQKGQHNGSIELLTSGGSGKYLVSITSVIDDIMHVYKQNDSTGWSIFPSLAEGKYSITIADQINTSCSTNSTVSLEAATDDNFLPITPADLDIKKTLAYPNPFTDQLNIIIPTDEKHVIHVYDLGSRLGVIPDVTIQQAGETHLNFSGVAPGIYMIRVESPRGLEYIKIVKE